MKRCIAMPMWFFSIARVVQGAAAHSVVFKIILLRQQQVQGQRARIVATLS